MKKLQRILALALCLVMVLALAACGNSSAPADNNANANAPADNSNAAPAGDGKVYSFNIDFPNPETASAYKALVDWSDYLKEQSGGRLDMKIYSGGALGALPDCVTNCETGVTDGFWSGVTIYPGVFPATEVMGLPMIGAKNYQVVNDVLNALLADYGVIADEWSQFKVVALHSSAGSPILFKDDISSVQEMAGKSLRISNAYTTEWFTNKGANPVTVGINDGYENIQKSVIAGGLFFFDQVESSALYEVIDTLYVGETIYPLNMLCLNKDKYDELPDDLKKIIDESGDFFLETSVNYFNEQVDRMTKVCEDNGVKILHQDDESRAWLAEGVESAWQKWVDTVTANGLPGQEILDKALEYTEQFNANYD